MQTRLLAAVLLAAALPLAYGQSSCSVISNADLANTIAINGESELTSDLLFTCTNGAVVAGPPPTVTLNIEMFLNTDVTSRYDGSLVVDTVMLLDDPAPAIQAAGTNVFPGTLSSANVVQWVGIPLPGGAHKYRIANIRANAHALGPVPTPVISTLDIVGSDGTNFAATNIPLAVTAIPLVFTTSPIVATFAPISGLNLNFTEGYKTAFKKRIENTGGPLTFQYQDVPGAPYCTESGFTPKYQVMPSPGEIGLADTSSRLLGTLTNLPPSVFVLIVPNEVTSSTGELVAHRVLPPSGPSDEFGTVLTIGGDSLVAVSPSHSASVLYEVAAAAPYAGVNGCNKIDTISIPVIPFLPNSLASATITGQLAPIDPTSSQPQASATAPEPRFVH